MPPSEAATGASDAVTLLSAISVVAFALIHVFIGRLRFLDVVPRSRWLSFAGGIAVAYVFLHVLPELGAHQYETIDGVDAAWTAMLSHEIYVVALLGLGTFYALERHMRAARAKANAESGGRHDHPPPAVFWLHASMFALYNAMIGYLLLHREDSGVQALATYTLAMGFHFLTTDFGLRKDYKHRYDAHARWLLAAAVAAGWIAGLAIEISELAVAMLFALLAGAVILNVLKEELPEERESRLLPFIAGLVGYGVLMQLVA